ncbi:hypothetical protein FRAAL3612 [Frankia alni ACN14a]|uniref:Uncharacterized protein n=1 Tax=Frankia alni (strain DSM 45986 / CECT 9034 / ACN14a) TaxID=326424 RepID=Q0RJQ7_FRAAA|nr:hypothetical protein FRAAL3612 [Frankia alni ACN14a]
MLMSRPGVGTVPDPRPPAFIVLVVPSGGIVLAHPAHPCGDVRHKAGWADRPADKQVHGYRYPRRIRASIC